MNSRWLNPSFVALIVVVLSAGLASGDGPQTRAVVIGISRYVDTTIQPRAHAEDDAKALCEVSRDQRCIGLPAENVRLLTGVDATRDKILAAIDWLAKESDPNDTALFFFFGQGAGLDKSGRQVGFLAYDSTVADRGATAVACETMQARWDKLACRFGVFLDISLTGYAIPTGEDEPSPAGFARCFLGDDELSDSLPGRFLSLAGGSIRPGLDLKDHGVFGHALLAGLRGGADREANEPDGVITVDELKRFLDREISALAAQNGKTRQER